MLMKLILQLCLRAHQNCIVLRQTSFVNDFRAQEENGWNGEELEKILSQLIINLRNEEKKTDFMLEYPLIAIFTTAQVYFVQLLRLLPKDETIKMDVK